MSERTSAADAAVTDAEASRCRLPKVLCLPRRVPCT